MIFYMFVALCVMLIIFSVIREVRNYLDIDELKCERDCFVFATIAGILWPLMLIMLVYGLAFNDV